MHIASAGATITDLGGANGMHEIAARSELTRLFGFEVDVLVLAPGGAWPSASPPVSGEDHAAVAEYVRSGGDPATLLSGAPC